ncbi:Uncharacterised protein [Sphingobacterium daejeonense]|nr:Uncharacterised protein [Sphingobacterium daejeonense]
MPHRWRCIGGDFHFYRYGMPTAFKRYFMPTAFNPDGVFAKYGHIFFYNSDTPLGNVIKLRILSCRFVVCVGPVLALFIRGLKLPWERSSLSDGQCVLEEIGRELPEDFPFPVFEKDGYQVFL